MEFGGRLSRKDKDIKWYWDVWS